MAVKPIKHRNNLGSADTSREPSPNIWGDCPFEAIQNGEIKGIAFHEDFVNAVNVAAAAQAAYGSYKGFASTGGSATGHSTEQGGVLVLSSDGDDEGASIGQVNPAFKISRASGKLWFEARIKTSTIADTKHGIFLGLIDASTLSATVPIAAAGTLADENFVGFHRLEGDGDYVDTVYKADGVTQVTVGADAKVLVADTYVKLGFVFEPGIDPFKHDTSLSGAAKYLLTFFADNLRLADTKQIPSADGTDFPNDVTLGWVFAVLNATASTPGNASIDWVRCAQLL